MSGGFCCSDSNFSNEYEKEIHSMQHEIKKLKSDNDSLRKVISTQSDGLLRVKRTIANQYNTKAGYEAIVKFYCYSTLNDARILMRKINNV